MAAIVFEVRKAEGRLLAAGASRELAEATADLMPEAVNLYLTKPPSSGGDKHGDATG
jgi:hypothetical protein